MSQFRGAPQGAPAVPEPPLQGTSQELQTLSGRCAKAALGIEKNILPGLKAGSDETKYLHYKGPISCFPEKISLLL